MGINDDYQFSALKGLLSGVSSPRPNRLSGVPPVTIVPVSSGPKQPGATTFAQVRDAEQRFDKRLQKLHDVLPIRNGRVVPADDDLPIGDARRLKLAVLFLDICGFSRIPSEEETQQDQVFEILNLFMAEMLQIVRTHEGDFEKNTGDGLMAYFKDGAEAQCAQRALDAAITMHCYNDQVISPRLKRIGLPEIKFRVGIEAGLVTIANVGVRGDHHSLVAVGTVANVACKLMNLLPNGGIVLGQYTRGLLPAEWQIETKSIGPLPGYLIKGTTTPYPAWELKYRVPDHDARWIFDVSGMLGG